MSATHQHVRLTHDVLNHQALTESVRSSQAGAVVLFLGTVREFTGELQTASLEYDAYGEMAQKTMQEIVDYATNRWPLTAIALEHRLGKLDLGEVSVAVAVSSPHRKDAFDAGRYVIDILKEKVPIWKKEIWADGSTEWVHPSEERGRQKEES